ncbi:MAG: beta-propeller fold lactonase family protein [Arenicella sp.]|nr:beta-propeller fold lactonase family protein [Arenicella sp.]
MFIYRKSGQRVLGLAVLIASSLLAISTSFASGGHGGGDSNDLKATTSGPIALSNDGRYLWSVVPDLDIVTVVSTATNEVVSTIKVADRPTSISITPNGKRVFVTNAASNSVTVIKVVTANQHQFKAKVARRAGIRGNITTGSEPQSVVASPDGMRVFVANSGQDTITVIDAKSFRNIGSVDLRNSSCNVGETDRHFQPRGLAVTADSKHLYVARFISFTAEGGTQRDDMGKEGVVCRLDIDTNSSSMSDYTVSHAIKMQSTDSGFLDKNGNATAAFPNQMQSIVIRDGKAYLPNIAASPTGPQRFNNNTQAYVNWIDGVGDDESDAGYLNLHVGGQDPVQGVQELYFANPWGIAFTNDSGEGDAYVISAGSDLLVKLSVSADGSLAFPIDEDTGQYIDLNNPDNADTAGANAGKNPLGVVINSAGTMAYTMNYISRNISVIDLTQGRVNKVISVADLPEPGSQEEQLLVGAEMFFSSRGNFFRPDGAMGSSRDRLSDKGRQNCASCHAEGLTDGIIWQFASGPRKTLAVNGTSNPKDISDQKIINATAVFDEVYDADFNTRLVSSIGFLDTPTTCVEQPPVTGATESIITPNNGLILGEDGDFEFAPCVMNQFAKPNEGRPQPYVQLHGSDVLVGAHDALVEWQRISVRTPNKPMTKRELVSLGASPVGGASELKSRVGRRIFAFAGCQECHNGGNWTSSTKDFVSPPDPSEIASEAGASNSNQAQFLYRFLKDIGSYGLNVAGRGNDIAGFPQIGGIEKDTNGNDALGYDYNGDGKGNGFNVSSILGSYSVQPYYHNGACETLECVVSDVSHRTAGLRDGRVDILERDLARTLLVDFLESIDETTRVFPR